AIFVQHLADDHSLRSHLKDDPVHILPVAYKNRSAAALIAVSAVRLAEESLTFRGQLIFPGLQIREGEAPGFVRLHRFAQRRLRTASDYGGGSGANEGYGCLLQRRTSLTVHHLAGDRSLRGCGLIAVGRAAGGQNDGANLHALPPTRSMTRDGVAWLPPAF